MRACRFHQQQAGAVHQLVTSTEPLLLLDEFKLERIASAPTGETKLLVTFELSASRSSPVLTKGVSIEALHHMGMPTATAVMCGRVAPYARLPMTVARSTSVASPK